MSSKDEVQIPQRSLGQLLAFRTSSTDEEGGSSLSSTSTASPRHNRGKTSRSKETSCSPSRSAKAAARSESSLAPCSITRRTLVPCPGGLCDRTACIDPTARTPPYLRRPCSVTSSRPRDGEHPAKEASFAQKTGRATTTDRGMNRESCRCCCCRPRTTRSPSFAAVCYHVTSREWTQSIAWALLNWSVPPYQACTSAPKCGPRKTFLAAPDKMIEPRPMTNFSSFWSPLNR